MCFCVPFLWKSLQLLARVLPFLSHIVCYIHDSTCASVILSQASPDCFRGNLFFIQSDAKILLLTLVADSELQKKGEKKVHHTFTNTHQFHGLTPILRILIYGII